MSNNKMATKADLQEMYQRILPYLGGMPEVLANKFSKGDMYSADEKMIGQWIDGKPLYQKVLNVSISIQAQTWYEASSIDTSGIETFVKCIGFLTSNNHVFNIDDCQCVDNHMWFYNSCQATLDKLLIQYTKTTDSPISIGNDTDYSTDEKIIGTWIDGKPLYQRVLNKTISTSNPVGNIPNGSTDLYQGNISISSDIPNIDIGMIDISHSYYLSSSASRGFMGAWYEKDTGDIWFSTLYERTNVSATFTINYTKTS